MAATRAALPALDVARIERFCERRIPTHLQDRVRVEAVIDGRSVTIVERRPPWRADFGPDWTSQAIARLRYTGSSGDWQLYWADRHGRWHRYEGVKPSKTVDRLLAEIEADPTSIFWG